MDASEKSEIACQGVDNSATLRKGERTYVKDYRPSEVAWVPLENFIPGCQFSKILIGPIPKQFQIRILR